MNADQRGAARRDAADGAAHPPADAVDFAAWVRPHLQPLANLVARLAPMADRDDVVQETLIRAWTKRHLFDPARGSPRAWLLAIGVDQATRSRRRLRGAAVADPVEAVAPDAFGEPDIRIALGRLSRRQRLSVECVYFVGLSVRETAVVMNCAEGTVKSTLADARAKLRTLLKVTG